MIHRIEMDDDELGEVISALDCQLDCSKEVLAEVLEEGSIADVIRQEAHVETLRQLVLRLRPLLPKEAADPE